MKKTRVTLAIDGRLINRARRVVRHVRGGKLAHLIEHAILIQVFYMERAFGLVNKPVRNSRLKRGRPRKGVSTRWRRL